jgi:AraC-like DNA-binding protein
MCPTIDKLLSAIRTSVVDIRFKELPLRHPQPLTPAELADEPRQRIKLLHLIAQEDPTWPDQARRWTAIVSVRHLRSLNNFRRKLVELLAQLSRAHEEKDLGHAFFLLMQQLYACHTYRGLEQLFPQLLESLLRHLAKARMPVGDLSRARCDAVKAAASFVRDRFREPISLEDVAAAAGVSGAHLARSWRKEIGCSVGEALRGLRLSEARRLLADGNRTVLDVALKCGFGSVEHFHRTFREQQGVSPDAWRRAITEEGASA